MDVQFKRPLPSNLAEMHPTAYAFETPMFVYGMLIQKKLTVTSSANFIKMVVRGRC